MATKLRYFVKLDSKNRPVAGSNLTRPKKPKNDTWLEIFPPNCCNVTLSDIPSATSGSEVILTLSCGGSTVLDASVTTAVANITQIANALNSAFSFFGTFSVDDTAIVLSIDSAVGAILCPTESLVMTITVS